MGIILFVIMVLFEIGLCVWSIRIGAGDEASLKKWQLGRVVIRLEQLALFIVIMLLPKVYFDFKYKGILVVISILLIYAAIKLLVSRTGKKQLKPRKKARAILATIGCIILFFIASVPAFVFADYKGLETSGKYGVKMAQGILVDESRIEEFETDGSHREVPVYFFYPDAEAAGESIEDMKLPLVIFSHGAFGYYQSNASTYMELASNGYVVVSLDHPYHSFFTKDTDGKMITVNQQFMNDVMYINDNNTPENDIYTISSKWLKLRSDDMNFVIDEIKSESELLAGGMSQESKLPENWFVEHDNIGSINEAIAMTDCSRIGLMGHSLGGASSVLVGRQRDDISAVIDLDGTMLGERTDYVDGKYVFTDDAYPVPLLSIDSILHHDEMEKEGEAYVNQYVINHAVDARETYIEDTAHMNFTDLPLFSPVLAKMLGTGTVDPEDCIRQINSIILNYYDEYLKN